MGCGGEMNLFDLSGKTALVTGCGGNLGPVWCDTLGNAGAIVHGIDFPDYDLSLPETPFRVFVRYGCPDILVNNAGIDNPPGSEATFFGNFDEIMRVNIGGAAHMAEALIPTMIDRGGGVIINVGSIQGFVGADWRSYDPPFEKPSGYNCSKAALSQLTRSISVQYGRYNIRSVTIAFGCVDTPNVSGAFAMKFLANVPLGKLISKRSLATTMLYVCCTPELSGQTIIVDGGYVSL
jgi:NAD(P)-dependent dehydrogenase (short-subunit alcohol dehydrogenase family)